jgi:hypothetical protein
MANLLGRGGEPFVELHPLVTLNKKRYAYMLLQPFSKKP